MYMFEPIRSRKIFEEAVDQIVGAIRRGDLQVGDRLPAERDLAAQLEISRPSVREAIKMLAEADIVEVRRGGGTYVKTEAILHRPESSSSFEISEIGALLEARRMIEPRVAQLAAFYGSEHDFRIMGQTVEGQRSALEANDRDRYLAYEAQFHIAMARTTRNDVIVGIVEQITTGLEPARDMILRSSGVTLDSAIDMHERTLRAIMSRDQGAVVEVMDEHLEDLERMWTEESGRGLRGSVPNFLRRPASA
jgi:GntR family transcriptional repressor for pyruvate dehydrogenase complex